MSGNPNSDEPKDSKDSNNSEEFFNALSVNTSPSTTQTQPQSSETQTQSQPPPPSTTQSQSAETQTQPQPPPPSATQSPPPSQPQPPSPPQPQPQPPPPSTTQPPPPQQPTQSPQPQATSKSNGIKKGSIMNLNSKPEIKSAMDHSMVSKIKEMKKKAEKKIGEVMEKKESENKNNNHKEGKKDLDNIVQNIDNNIDVLARYDSGIEKNKDAPLNPSSFHISSPSSGPSLSPSPSPSSSSGPGLSPSPSPSVSPSLGTTYMERQDIRQLQSNQNTSSSLSQGLKYLNEIKRLHSEMKQKLTLAEDSFKSMSGGSKRYKLERELAMKEKELREMKEIDVKQLEYKAKSMQEELDVEKLKLVEIKDDLFNMEQRYPDKKILEDVQKLKLYEQKNKEFRIQQLESDLQSMKKKIYASRGQGGPTVRQKIEADIQNLKNEILTGKTNDDNVIELRNAVDLLASNEKKARMEFERLQISVNQNNALESKRLLEKLAMLNEESNNAVYGWRKQSNVFSDEMNDIKGQLKTIDKGDPYSLKKWRMELDKLERKLQEREIEVEKAHKCMKPLEVIGSKFSPKFNSIVLDRLNLKFDNLESSLNMMENSFINDFVRLTNGFVNQFDNDRKKSQEKADKMQQQRQFDVQVKRENLRLDDINNERERVELMKLKESETQAKQDRLKEIANYYKGRSSNEYVQLSKESIERAMIQSDESFKPFAQVENDETINTAVKDELHHLLAYLLIATMYVQQKYESFVEAIQKDELGQEKEQQPPYPTRQEFLYTLNEISKEIRMFGKSNELNFGGERELTILVDTSKDLIFNLYNSVKNSKGSEVNTTFQALRELVTRLKKSKEDDANPSIPTQDGESSQSSLVGDPSSLPAPSSDPSSPPSPSSPSTESLYDQMMKARDALHTSRQKTKSAYLNFLKRQIDEAENEFYFVKSNLTKVPNQATQSNPSANEEKVLNAMIVQKRVESVKRNAELVYTRVFKESFDDFQQDIDLTQMKKSLSELKGKVGSLESQLHTIIKEAGEKVGELDTHSIITELTNKETKEIEGIIAGFDDKARNGHSFFEGIKARGRTTGKKIKQGGNIDQEILTTAVSNLNIVDNYLREIDRYRVAMQSIETHQSEIRDKILPKLPAGDKSIVGQILGFYTKLIPDIENNATALFELLKSLKEVLKVDIDGYKYIKFSNILKAPRKTFLEYFLGKKDDQGKNQNQNQSESEMRKKMENDLSDLKTKYGRDENTQEKISNALNENIRSYNSNHKKYGEANQKLNESFTGVTSSLKEELNKLEVTSNRITELKQSISSLSKSENDLTKIDASLDTMRKTDGYTNLSAEHRSFVEDQVFKPLEEKSKILRETMKEQNALQEQIDGIVARREGKKKLSDGITLSFEEEREKEKESEKAASRLLKHVTDLVEEAKQLVKRFVPIFNPTSLNDPVLQPFKKDKKKDKDPQAETITQSIEGTQYGQGIEGIQGNEGNEGIQYGQGIEGTQNFGQLPQFKSSVKYDVDRERSFFRNYDSTIQMANKYILNYRQKHFDFLTKITKKKFKYLNKWRKIEDYKSGLKPYMREIEEIDKRMIDMSDRANQFIEDKFLKTFNMQLDKFDLRYIAYPEDRLKLIEKANIFRNTLLEINDKVTTYYKKRITWVDIVTDYQFLMAYILKIMSFGIFFLSLNYAEKFFIDMYVNKVYKSGERAPSLLLFALLVVGLTCLGNFLITLVLWYLMFLYKKSTNLFIVDKYLIKGFVKDSLAYTLFVLLVSCLVSVVLQNKQYYRYHSEGPRATRIVKTTMLYSMIIAILFPMFYLL